MWKRKTNSSHICKPFIFLPCKHESVYFTGFNKPCVQRCANIRLNG